MRRCGTGRRSHARQSKETKSQQFLKWHCKFSVSFVGHNYQIRNRHLSMRSEQVGMTTS
ncbi:hypothetical protein HNR26_003262 [Rhizobium rosettiformans]|uniref:Uncharacterized protein n=1 Tax=Rhizobium rosettiformans TaxID=1368430 RepID=A0A7W8MDT7_9HYPH|nr:hypothetical protein [Rhizobium rosettiformans]